MRLYDATNGVSLTIHNTDRDLRRSGMKHYATAGQTDGGERRSIVNAIAATAMTGNVDPWSHMVFWLEKMAEYVDRPDHASSKRAHRADAISGPAHRSIVADGERAKVAPAVTASITVVERFSANSVSITWRDSQAGNYCEQLWVRRISKSQGVCALTGARIVRGDAVYGLASRATRRPMNLAQMILARPIEEIGQASY
jgi:hypothetical protein